MKRNKRIKSWLVTFAVTALIVVALSWVGDEQPTSAPAARITYRT